MPVVKGRTHTWRISTIDQIDSNVQRLSRLAKASADPVHAIDLLADVDALLEARYEMVSSTPAASPQG